MSAETTTAGVPVLRHRSRSVAVISTILVLSGLGLLGLWRALGQEVVVTGAVWALVAAGVWAVYGALLIGLVVFLQRLGRRPAWAVWLALAWGGLAATAVAGRANTAIVAVATNLSSADPGWATWLTAPLVEEPVKALGVVLLVLVPVLSRFGPLDGLFFGAFVGASFQVVENFSFSLVAMSNSPDEPLRALLVYVFLRGVLGVFSHVVFTGLVGAAIGWVVVGRAGERARRTVLAVMTGLSVVVLHGLMNWAATRNTVWLYLAAGTVGFVVLVVVLLRIRRAETRRLVREATAAGGWGVLTVDDVAFLATESEDRESRRRRHRLLAKLATAERMGIG